MQEKTKQRAKEPIAVDGVVPAAEGQAFYCDPSYVLRRKCICQARICFIKLEQE